jgi:predicted MarR family transcription regulator
VLILHHINHRARNKKLADICFVLNYEDTHVVAYALKKLVACRASCTPRSSARRFFMHRRPQGEAAIARYREVREECLIGNLDADLNDDIGDVARTLRTMSGQYDQAARAATSL